MMQSYKQIQNRQEQQELVNIGVATLGMLTAGGMVLIVVGLVAVTLVQLGGLI